MKFFEAIRSRVDREVGARHSGDSAPGKISGVPTTFVSSTRIASQYVQLAFCQGFLGRHAARAALPRPARPAPMSQRSLTGPSVHIDGEGQVGVGRQVGALALGPRVGRGEMEVVRGGVDDQVTVVGSRGFAPGASVCS